MGKFCGLIGFAETVEDPPGIWTEKITERTYYGDVTKNVRKLEAGESVNDDVNIANSISILADPYACEHIYAMRYVVWFGSKWKVKSVEVAYPRLNLTVGGLYNG